jgi:hypothetical protein
MVRGKDWVVYSKPPFGSPEQVLRYLARYTHRVAISNRRLLALEDGRITFRYKDYAQDNQEKEMTLDAAEFLRRFLLHVIPKRFVRIRTYGFLANRNRKANVERCREAIRRLGIACEAETGTTPDLGEVPESDAGIEEPRDPERCPVCEEGFLMRIATRLTSNELARLLCRFAEIEGIDSS